MMSAVRNSGGHVVHHLILFARSAGEAFVTTQENGTFRHKVALCPCFAEALISSNRSKMLTPLNLRPVEGVPQGLTDLGMK